MNFKQMLLNFRKKRLVAFLLCKFGKDETHKQYGVSVTVHMGRKANQRKVPKWLQFENYTLESLNI